MRVLTWPLVTSFGFPGHPELQKFLEPTVTQVAARKSGFELAYASPPSRPVGASLLQFAEKTWRDVRDLRPRDMIELHFFVWVRGLDE